MFQDNKDLLSAFHARGVRAIRPALLLPDDNITLSSNKSCAVTPPGLRSQALVVEHRPEGTGDLRHFLLGPQHGAYVFVGGRRLITEAIHLAGVVPNSLHLLAEGPLGHLPSSRGPAQHPACAVGARTQSLFAAPPLNVEAESAHRAWEDPTLAKLSRHRTLPMNPKIVPAVLFERHAIVVGGYDRVPIDMRSQLPV